MPDLTVTPGAVSGPAAFAHAGIGPTTSTCSRPTTRSPSPRCCTSRTSASAPRAKAAPFVEDGKLGPGGALPTNTNGGGLSYTHPGQYGIFLLVEAVRQLRGIRGERQVPDAEIAVAHGCGGVLSSTGTVVLGTEATL